MTPTGLTADLIQCDDALQVAMPHLGFPISVILDRLNQAHVDPRMILDVGCGFGRLAESLARAFPLSTVLGLDLNPLATQRARQRVVQTPGLRQRVGFRSADCSDLKNPFCGLQPYDVVTFTGVGSIFPSSSALLSLAAGWLSPSGTVVLDSAIVVPSQDPIKDTVHRLRSELLKQQALRLIAVSQDVKLHRFNRDTATLRITRLTNRKPPGASGDGSSSEEFDAAQEKLLRSLSLEPRFGLVVQILWTFKLGQ